jgi:putative DNA primase/helicase
MTPIELVLSKLDKVQHRRDGIWACCPAHADRTPSMKVWESDDGACCVKCFSMNCTTEQIMHAIGLTAKDRFPPKEERKKPVRRSKPKTDLGRELRSHWYTDLEGNKVHVAIKFEGGWRQKRLEGKKLVWGLEGIRTYLFRVPELVDAVRAGKEIWVAEGEKDADRINLEAQNTDAELFATTNPMGAQNWKQDYTDWIRGCNVVLVRDPDQAGFKRCKHLFTELTAAGCKVRAVQAKDPRKDEAGAWIVKDAFDHLEAGHTLDEFQTVDPAEKWKEAEQEPSGTLELAIVEGGAGGDGGDGPPAPRSPTHSGGTWYPQTEHGNCRRLLDKFGQDVRWVPKFGAWLVWDGNRWVQDETEGAPLQERAVQVIRDLEARLKDLEAGSGAHKNLLKFISMSASKRGIDAMINLAKREPGIAISPDILDANDWVVGAPNGVIDLTTGTLRKGRRDDFITQQLGVAFDPDAKCPQFREFLNSALQGDQELYSYTWRAMGYTLTGSIKAECFFFAHGPGGGGKGTVFRMLKSVMGTYSKSLRAASLQAKNVDAIPQDIAKLKGARIVMVHETAENKRFDENLIKELTGGNEVTARFMRENEFEYLPKFKLWIAGNHKPDIISFDRSWRRRLRLLPFEHIVPDAQVDEELKERLAAQEAAGVLAQMVRYCVKWQAEGMKEAKAMKDALEQYQEESDSVMRFLDECCEVDKFNDDISTPANDLFMAYSKWAKQLGLWCGSAVWFGKDLRLKGFERARSAKGKKYVGIWLVPDQESLGGKGDPKYDH